MTVEGAQIDLATTAFAALPDAWRAETRAAARAALRSVEAPTDVWDDLLVAYEQLSEAERDKDRTIARLALGCD